MPSFAVLIVLGYILLIACFLRISANAMDRITFLSRRYAAQLRPPANAVLISIHDKTEPELQVRDGWGAVLYLRFHDSNGHMLGMEDFSDEHAARIFDFVGAHVACDELVVHCQMGQSRSAAVALFLAEHLGVMCQRPQPSRPGGAPFTARREPVVRSGYPIYNRRVYGVLARALSGEAGARFQAAAGY